MGYCRIADILPPRRDALRPRPARLHLNDFFVQGDRDLIVALVESLFSLIHHAFSFRVVG